VTHVHAFCIKSSSQWILWTESAEQGERSWLQTGLGDPCSLGMKSSSKPTLRDANGIDRARRGWLMGRSDPCPLGMSEFILSALRMRWADLKERGWMSRRLADREERSWWRGLARRHVRVHSVAMTSSSRPACEVAWLWDASKVGWSYRSRCHVLLAGEFGSLSKSRTLVDRQG